MATQKAQVQLTKAREAYERAHDNAVSITDALEDCFIEQQVEGRMAAARFVRKLIQEVNCELNDIVRGEGDTPQ